MVKLWLLRHGDRSYQVEDGLSEKGLEQASRLAGVFEASLHGFPNRIWSSPRKRTQDTVSPLLKHLGLHFDQDTVQVRAELEERRSHESRPDFVRRVQSVLLDLEDQLQAQTKSHDSVLIVSHVDWLHEATRHLMDHQPGDLEPLFFEPFELQGYTYVTSQHRFERVY